MNDWRAELVTVYHTDVCVLNNSVFFGHFWRVSNVGYSFDRFLFQQDNPRLRRLTHRARVSKTNFSYSSLVPRTRSQLKSTNLSSGCHKNVDNIWSNQTILPWYQKILTSRSFQPCITLGVQTGWKLAK